ncbi:MAG: DMT family transporter [Caulobacterales bacterium]|nr:DMT family transporter [Caulobacterales bacterium]
MTAAGGATLLGLSPIFVRLSELDPQATNFWRFALALPILGVWAALSGAERGGTARQISWLLLAGLFFGAEVGLWAAALDFTTVANATLLSNMTPIFAAAFGFLLFKERLQTGIWIGGGLALLGALTLSIARARAGAGPTPELGWLGDTMGLVSATGYAAYLLIVRSLATRVSTGAVMLWATLAAMVFAAGASVLMGESFLPTTWQGWLPLIGLGLIVQAAAQGLIAYGVGRLPIVVSTILLWMQPLSAALMSWLFFGEALGPLALFGAGLILLGVFLVQRARQ